jgi:hypothetical protein
MARALAPTPHRIALCALARYLNPPDADDLDALDASASFARPDPFLGPGERRALSRLLADECASADGFEEPTARDFHAFLDARSRALGANPARPLDPSEPVAAFLREIDDDDDDDDDDRPRDDVVDHLRGRPKSDDGPSPPPPACANANDDALSSFPLNFADVFREALARVRTVDDLATLFSDVEPRSRHAEAMRSGGGDPPLGDRPDASAFASAVEPDSVLGLFLRRCVADHERLSFEGACVAFAAFLRYADEAAGCLLDGDDDALEALGVALERAASEGGSLSLARRKHSSAAALRSSALGGGLGGPPSALAASRKLRDETLDGRLLADVAHDGVGDAPPEEGPFPHRRGAASSLSRADDVTAWAPPWRAIAATSSGVRRFERDRTAEGGPEGGPEGFEGFGAGSGSEAARDATRIRGSVRGSSFARPDTVVASLVRRASTRADADYGDFDRSRAMNDESGFDGGGVIFSGGSLGGALASEAAPSGGGGCGDVHERLGASALPPGHPARHRLRHSASVRTRDVFAADDHLRRRFDARDPWGESGSVGDAAGVGARGGPFFAADPFSFARDGGDAPGSSSSAASGAAASAKLQSALLALAATHAAFAHAPEARKALDEATRAAQQRGDEVALAHALAHRVALEEIFNPTNQGSSIREDDRTRSSIADGGPLDDRVRRRSGGGHARGPGGRFGGSGGGGSALARLASRAAALRQPHLLAFAELASARRAAARVRFSRAPPSSSGGKGSQGGGSRGLLAGGVGAGVVGAGGVGGVVAGAGAGGGAFPLALGGDDAEATSARALRRMVLASAPARVGRAARLVESLAHASALASAAGDARIPSRGDEPGTSPGEAARASGGGVYPARSKLAPDAATAAAAEAPTRALVGSASALAAATWDAHGAPSLARLAALKHLRADAADSSRRLNAASLSVRGEEDDKDKDATLFLRGREEETTPPPPPPAASASDTASALATLAAHACSHHGSEAARAALEAVSRFRRVRDVGASAAALAEAISARVAFADAATRSDAEAATALAAKMAALAGGISGGHLAGSEAWIEARRASAEAHLVAGRLAEARAEARGAAAAATRAGLPHAAAAATTTLAEIALASRAPAEALRHALALEHASAAAGLDGRRAAAVVCVAEAWLALHQKSGARGFATGGTRAPSKNASSSSSSPPPPRVTYASMARDALDAHMPALLGAGGLALRCRARLCAAKARLWTSEDVAALREHRASIFAPLEDAAAWARLCGAAEAEAEAHYLRATTYDALGERAPRNEAAREWRRCERRAREARGARSRGGSETPPTRLSRRR